MPGHRRDRLLFFGFGFEDAAFFSASDDADQEAAVVLVVVRGASRDAAAELAEPRALRNSPFGVDGPARFPRRRPRRWLRRALIDVVAGDADVDGVAVVGARRGGDVPGESARVGAASIDTFESIVSPRGDALGEARGFAEDRVPSDGRLCGRSWVSRRVSSRKSWPNSCHSRGHARPYPGRHPPAEMASSTASARCALVAPAANARGRLSAERDIHPVRRSATTVSVPGRAFDRRHDASAVGAHAPEAPRARAASVPPPRPPP